MGNEKDKAAFRGNFWIEFSGNHNCYCMRMQDLFGKSVVSNCNILFYIDNPCI